VPTRPEQSAQSSSATRNGPSSLHFCSDLFRFSVGYRLTQFDIRSMRKVQESEEGPVLVVENQDSGETMNTFVHVSMLILRT
jgi:hypothetical protein